MAIRKRSVAVEVAGAVLAAALAGCSGGGLPENQPVVSQVALKPFESCSELERYIEDTAELQMRSQLEQLKQQPYGYWGWPATAEDGDFGGGAGRESGGPGAYTTTNNQVEGVDEADFVKNDGTRIFVLSGNSLYLNESWPADQLRTVGRLTVEGYPREMFLDGDRVVIFSGVFTPMPNEGRGANDGAAYCTESLDCAYFYANTLKVTVVNVSNLAKPAVVGEVYLPGQYLSARKIGGSVRLVSTDSIRWPSSVQWYPDHQPGPWEDRGMWAAAIDRLIEKNARAIRDASLTQWLPLGRYRGPDGAAHEVGYDCAQFSRSNAPTELGLVTVSTLELNPETMAVNNGPRVHRTSVVAAAGEIYASPSALYVASRHWWWWPQFGQTDHTYLHKFDLGDPARAVHVASGGVAGDIVDQFSLDEHEGFLRVATTLRTRVRDEQNPENGWGRMITSNRITVLGQDGGRLVKVGETPEIAAGETIFSVRFKGPRGFVVTFLQIDPLFTFDLSDPANPRAVGELKVPGFSTYLHPLDEDHLLTIGVDSGADRSNRLQLSIFDVSDFANPTLKFTQTVGNAWGWSEALHEHKAFNYFPERKLLAIPFSDWGQSWSNGNDYWSSFVSDLRVFEVSTETGFTPKGALSLGDLYQAQSYQWDGRVWTYYWTPAVRRSVMADNFVYAISDAGIRVADVESLASPLKTTLFERYQP